MSFEYWSHNQLLKYFEVLSEWSDRKGITKTLEAVKEELNKRNKPNADKPKKSKKCGRTKTPLSNNLFNDKHIDHNIRKVRHNSFKEVADQRAKKMAQHMAKGVSQQCWVCNIDYLQRSPHDRICPHCEPYFYDCQKTIESGSRIHSWLIMQWMKGKK